jgi:DNA polymerase eta
MLRLNLPDSQPLAVRQWDGLIAVNYAARAAGISRHMRADEALRICPHIRLQHVELIDGNGVVSDNATNMTQANAKASLARYRRASASIFALLVKCVGDACVEKASVDEAYLDINAAVDRLLRGEEALLPLTPSSSASALSRPSLASLRAVLLATQDTAVVQSSNSEDAGPSRGSGASWLPDEALDACDARVLAGSIVASQIRARLKADLGFTASAGLAPTKMLAKLVAGRHKPASQTILPPPHINALLSRTTIASLRFLGGKVGDALAACVADPSKACAPVPSDFKEDDSEDEDADSDAGEEPEAAETTGALAAKSTRPSEHITAGAAQSLPLARLRSVFGAEHGLLLWRLVRGADDSPLVPRSKVKSIMCAKSFSVRDCRTLADATRYLAMNCVELAARLEDVAPRTAKTFVLSYRRADGAAGGSRSMPMPSPPHSRESLLRVAQSLLRRAAADSGASTVSAGGQRREDAEIVFPCVSLAVGAQHLFEAAGQDLRGLFAAQAESSAAASSASSAGNKRVSIAEPARQAPKRRAGGIDSFFAKATAVGEGGKPPAAVCDVVELLDSD